MQFLQFDFDHKKTNRSAARRPQEAEANNHSSGSQDSSELAEHQQPGATHSGRGNSSTRLPSTHSKRAGGCFQPEMFPKGSELQTEIATDSSKGAALQSLHRVATELLKIYDLNKDNSRNQLIKIAFKMSHLELHRSHHICDRYDTIRPYFHNMFNQRHPIPTQHLQAMATAPFLRLDSKLDSVRANNPQASSTDLTISASPDQGPNPQSPGWWRRTGSNSDAPPVNPAPQSGLCPAAPKRG